MVEQPAVILGPRRDDQLHVGPHVHHALEHPQGMIAGGDFLGCLGEREDLLDLVENHDQGVRQPVRDPRQDVREQLRIAPQCLAKRGEIGRRPEGLIDQQAKVHRLLLAIRRFVAKRLRRGVEHGLSRPADQVLGGLDDPHRTVGPAEELVADALFLQVGNHAGAQEGALARSALAVQDQDLRVRPVQRRGEPYDVGVAAGEQGAILPVVERQRAVRFVG